MGVLEVAELSIRIGGIVKSFKIFAIPKGEGVDKKHSKCDVS